MLFKTSIKIFFYWFFIISISSISILYSQNNLTDKNVALSGYDPVSYFSSSPVKGKKEHQVLYQEVVYYFLNETNKKLFEKTPENYLPQYGGWCAYAMGRSGEKVIIDPESFTIEEGKLYLFYKSIFNDTRKKWQNNIPPLKEKANLNWDKIQNNGTL